MHVLLLQQHSVMSSQIIAQAGHYCACQYFVYLGSDDSQQQVTLSIDKQETKQVTSFRQATQS